MQGQKGAIGSLPESIGFEHGSTSSDSGVVEQQICWTNFIQDPRSDANQETQNLTMWSMGESSSSSMPNPVRQNRVNPHELPASMLSLGDVNNGHHGLNVTVNPSTYISKKTSNYASSSSGPVEMVTRLSHKRKASELSIGQSSSGIESSNFFQRPEGSNSVWQSVSENPTPANTTHFDPIIPRLGSGIGGVPENIRRNVRIRINNSRQQDQLPASTSNINNNALRSFSSPYPSLGLNLEAPTGGSSSSRAGQPMLRVPALTRSLHASSRHRSSSSRAIASYIISGSGDNSRTMPTNISDHPLFAQTSAVNLDLNSIGGNGNGNVTNNGSAIASTSNPIPNSRPHRGSSLYSSRRHAELLRRYLSPPVGPGAAGGGGEGQNSALFTSLPPPVNASASSSQETGIPRVGSMTGHHPHHHLARTSDRQVDGAFGFPYLSRAVAGGSERRGRLVSELMQMRNVLDRIRRGEGLRFEDVMILDHMSYGMADIHDQHRDMRLDIDNMSYEELLALEERIGNVNTGLTEENIYKHMKQKTYASVEGQPDAEPCCICQEEYKNGDDLGALGCGHEFHTGCIKQWLLQKNSCPVCKSAASK